MAWAEGLRDDQAKAASAPPEHIVLLAGPGTGKTHVLVRRVEYLVGELSIKPEAIAALTFTKAAAAEMRGRLEDRLGDLGKKVRVSTLHSYALRELLKHGEGNLPLPLRVVGDWEERYVVVEELARMLGRGVNELSNSRGDGALDRLADDWDTLAADGEGWESGYPDPKFLDAWRRHREVYGYTLRSELVYQLLSELRANPSFDPGKGIEMLVVDEYQDLNHCDLETVRMIAMRCNAHVFAAGDDDQSIYSFRNAHPAGIRGFGDDYSPSTRLLMTECMRCGQEVVDVANWLIEQEPNRVSKTLVSVTDWGASVTLLRFNDQEVEADSVAEIVRREITAGTLPEQILVLMKSDTRGRVSSAVADELHEYGIDSYLPRRSPTLEEPVVLLLEYLALSQSVEKELVDHLALRAILQLDTENGVGATRIRNVVNFCLDRSIRFYEAIDYARTHAEECKPSTWKKTIEATDKALGIASELKQQDDEDFDQWLVRVQGSMGISDADFEVIIQATHQIVGELEDELEVAEEEDDQDKRSVARHDFVQELQVAMTGLGETLPSVLEGKVTITTMHGAKGLDAEVVIMLQAEDEVIPGNAIGAEIDEARRLLYVSLTRAKERLLITACLERTGPQRFTGSIEAVGRNLTRFLRDLGMVAMTPKQYLDSL